MSEACDKHGIYDKYIYFTQCGKCYKYTGKKKSAPKNTRLVSGSIEIRLEIVVKYEG